jgi:hypothetical protein
VLAAACPSMLQTSLGFSLASSLGLWNRYDTQYSNIPPEKVKNHLGPNPSPSRRVDSLKVPGRPCLAISRRMLLRPGYFVTIRTVEEQPVAPSLMYPGRISHRNAHRQCCPMPRAPPPLQRSEFFGKKKWKPSKK